MNSLQIINQLVSWAIDTNIQGAFLILLVLALRRLLRGRLHPGYLFALWILVLVRFSMPGLPASPFSLDRYAPSFGRMAGVVSSLNATPIRPSPPAESASRIAPAGGRTLVDGIAVEPARPQAPEVPVASDVVMGKARRVVLSWRGVLAYVWLAGAAVLLLRQGVASVVFRIRMARWSRVDDPELVRIVEDCCAVLGLRRSVPMRISDEVQSPCVYGMIWPTIVLPRHLLKELDRNEWRRVLLHECSHVRRWDGLSNAWANLLTAIHWMNPLVWVAVRRLRVDREVACDAMALEHDGGMDRRDYAATLLKLVNGVEILPGRPWVTVGILEDKEPLKARLRAIVSPGPARRFPVIGGAVMLLLAMASLTRSAESAGGITPVDLMRHHDYPVSRVEPGVLQSRVDDAGMWSQVPKGRVEFAGVPFDVTGLIRLAGRDAQRDGRYFAPHANGIPVGRSFDRLYVLHGTYYYDDEGATISKARLHYRDGTTADLDIQYGRHVRNYWRQKYENPIRLADAESRVVWTADSPMLAEYGNSLRLCASSLHNPNPEKVVETVDLVSTMSGASSIIVALSVGGADLPAEWAMTRPQPEPEQVWEGRLRFRTVDGTTGSPIAGARLRFEAAEPESHFRIGSYTTDADGYATVRYPHKRLSNFDIWVNCDGYLTKIVHWERKTRGEFPDEYVYRAEKGVTISGRLLDAGGKPVAGAFVRYPRLPMRFDAGVEVLAVGSDYAVSDSRGEWKATLPAGVEGYFVVEHGAFPTIQRIQAPGIPVPGKPFITTLPQPAPTGPVQNVTGPYNPNAVFQQKRRVKVEVVGMDGKPIPGALVEPAHNQMEVFGGWRGMTDARGLVVWSNAPAIAVQPDLQLVASAAGYYSGAEFLPSGNDQLKLRLFKVEEIRGRVVDAETDAPVPHFRVFASPGNPVRWRRQPDVIGRNGTYRLSRLPSNALSPSAPAVVMRVDALGYQESGPITVDRGLTELPVIKLRRLPK